MMGGEIAYIGGHGHVSDSSKLYEEKYDDLTEEGVCVSEVDSGKSCRRDSRDGSEQIVEPVDITPPCRKREHQQCEPDEHIDEIACQDISFRPLGIDTEKHPLECPETLQKITHDA